MSKEPSSSVCKVCVWEGLEGGCAYNVEGREDDTLNDVKKIPEIMYCFILLLSCPFIISILGLFYSVHNIIV